MLLHYIYIFTVMCLFIYTIKNPPVVVNHTLFQTNRSRMTQIADVL